MLIPVLAIILENVYGQADTVTSISIKAIPGLQFDLPRFQVKPGVKVVLSLTNADDMSHNLLITRPGAREQVVQAAIKLGEGGPKKDYVPDSPEVLWYIPVLTPEQTESITFKAPETPGVYPYVCTYPGHGIVMYGAMYVSTQPMPDIKLDTHIPPGRRAEEAKLSNHAAHTAPTSTIHHPYQPTAPYMYRIFMPDASPATIAVHLPQNLSYCWDAGSCSLQYAWQGGFLANTDQWQGKGDTYGKVAGTIFFRNKSIYPFLLGKSNTIPQVEYIGYKLINRYPEFHYKINKTDIYELITPKADGNGLVRIFRIPQAQDTVWFTIHPEDGVMYESSIGKWIGHRLKLSPGQAKEFTINMTIKEGAGL